MKTNIYSENDFRKILQENVLARKKLDPSCNFQNMAEHIRVPKSYLSNFLKGDANLNEDQLYLACQYLEFKEEESEYLHLLMAHSKSNIPERKRTLAEKLRKIQSQKMKTENFMKDTKKVESGNSFNFYYLDPYYQVIHMCLCLPKFQGNLPALAELLGIDRPKLGSYIIELEKAGLVKNEKERYKTTEEKIHLAKDSPVFATWKNQMRTLSGFKLLRDHEKSYTFSVLFCSDPGTRNKIQALFFEYIKEVQTLVDKSKSQEVYQMNFDFFGWTD